MAKPDPFDEVRMLFCALFVTLISKNLLEKAVETPKSFLETLSDSNYRPHLLEAPHHPSLFVNH
jgi:hypothetical protein